MTEKDLEDADIALSEFSRRIALLDVLTNSMKGVRQEPKRSESFSQFEARLRRPLPRKKEPTFLPIQSSGPAGCCMYPFPDPDGLGAGPLYPSSSLPATLNVNFGGADNTFNLGGGYTYTGTIAGVPMLLTADDPGAAAWYIQNPSTLEVVSSSICLVHPAWTGGYTVTDQFSTSYVVTISGYTITMERLEDDYCTWGGNSEGFEASASVYYNESTFRFEMNYNIVVDDPPTIVTGIPKDDPQDSPAGSYGGNVVS